MFHFSCAALYIMLHTLRDGILVLLLLLQALCAVLEYEICDNNDVKMQIITTLQITSRGKRMYADLCERQIQLRELVCFVL